MLSDSSLACSLYEGVSCGMALTWPWLLLCTPCASVFAICRSDKQKAVHLKAVPVTGSRSKLQLLAQVASVVAQAPNICKWSALTCATALNLCFVIQPTCLSGSECATAFLSACMLPVHVEHHTCFPGPGT